MPAADGNDLLARIVERLRDAASEIGFSTDPLAELLREAADEIGGLRDAIQWMCTEMPEWWEDEAEESGRGHVVETVRRVNGVEL